MFYFRVERLSGDKIIISCDDLKSCKKEYNKVMNSYDFISISPIHYEKRK